jgi:hypothetical protein
VLNDDNNNNNATDRSTGRDELVPIYTIELYKKYHEKEASNFRE